jgi:hypothetical protein
MSAHDREAVVVGLRAFSEAAGEVGEADWAVAPAPLGPPEGPGSGAVAPPRRPRDVAEQPC